MSEQDNRQLVQEQFSAFNAHDVERYVKSHANDYVWESDAFPQPVRGHDELRQAIGMFFRGFPDLHLDIEQVITSGDNTVVRWRASGTHQGDFNGIAPTNRKVNVRGCTVSEVKNGEITKSATYSDQLALLQQLGVSAAKAASAT
jgi:steroid delta-isomerase-like uncharacterized protein